MASQNSDATETKASSTPLHVLHVEDNEIDAELVATMLRRGGHECDVLRVDKLEDCKTALERERFDLILADYTLTGFEGTEVLTMAAQLQPSTPFIFVSATLGEEIAIETVKRGATDFVLKHSLGRLIPSVRRALRESEGREKRREAEAALLASERRFRFLAQATEVLSRSLNYHATLPEVAQYAVPELADWCAIYTLEGGVLQLAALANADPLRAERIRELLTQCPDDVASIYGQLPAMQNREAYFCEVGDCACGIPARPQHSAIHEELRAKAFMCAPLLAREQILGLLCFIYTESERKFSKTDLELATDLARRVAANVENAKLYEEAQEAIRARDEFLSIASHELKTPLTSLQLEVQMLMRVMRKGTTMVPQIAGRGTLSEEPTPVGMPSPGQLASKMEALDRQIRKLSKLVNNLLDVSRLAAGRFEIRREEVDLSLVTSDVVSRFRQQVELAGGTLDLFAPEAIVGNWDRLRIEQVVTNLISNALKYGRGRPIGIRAEHVDGRARLTVKDNGIGIATEDVQRIFDRFTRASGSRNYAGLGLGLYIVKQIVDRLGGTVSVDSELGVGSTFTVELPMGIDSATGSI
jgi:signal transduction histidine kinase/FixJ family two-component response regulator